MGVWLKDLVDESVTLDLNFWNWRPIVEAIKRLEILPPQVAEDLHQSFVGRLSKTDAHSIASGLRAAGLSSLRADQRLLLDGTITDEPDDFAFHREPEKSDLNYSTVPHALQGFIEFCERGSGFEVL